MDSEYRQLYKVIENQIKRPLSNYDIERALHGKIKIEKYNNLQNHNINTFFEPYNMVGLLYQFEGKNIGHWVLLIRLNRDTVEFFDPYGNVLDIDLLKVKFPKLTKLLYNGGIKNIYFNNTKLQTLENDVSTCGRWIFLRAFFRQIPLDKFINMVKNNGITKLYDLFVYFMTSDL